MPAPRPDPDFEIPIVVRAEDIDHMDHVNNVVFLRWVQEVALAHWHARATPEMLRDLGWVATRHELDYFREARLGEPLVARTWIGQVDSRRFERLTEIVRPSDNALLAQGRTLWTMVSRATGRITRIPDALRERFPSAAQTTATAKHG
ncbi:MAG: acyl-CoA thioesterase [Gemmatimonadetes bacterium]|nr:acyl-CoA thioesterase [Gemmatimonadota bacterium]